MGGDELAPGRDDAGGIAAELAHVGEEDLARLAVERVSEEVDLVGVDDREDLLPRRHAVADERADPVHELVATPVEERLVTEGHLGRRRTPNRTSLTLKQSLI